MRNHLRFCIISLLLSGCVSVQLPGGKITPAKDVQFTAPDSPFYAIKAVNADKTWISSETGNTISYLSECGGSNEPSLQSIESDSLGALNQMSLLTSESLNYNGREARQSLAKGEVDGVPVQLSLLIFKKNGCVYTLSYGGLQKQFAAETKHFENFKKNFKAP